MTTCGSPSPQQRDAAHSTVLVTGGTGFVGRQVVRCLLDAKCRTRILCRSVPAKVDLDKRLDAIHVTTNLFSDSAERLAEYIQGVDTLIHCAWCVGLPDYVTAIDNVDCLQGTIRLAQVFAASGGRRFVGIGTCAEYDQSADVLKPTTPLRPTNLYAACKAAAFLTLNSLLPQQGVTFAWCRLFYLFGEGERPDRLVPYVRDHLNKGLPIQLTNGTQVRDFLDVREAGPMIANAALSDESGPINICSERGVTVREFVERIADEYRRRDLLRFGERPSNVFDPPVIIGRRN